MADKTTHDFPDCYRYGNKADQRLIAQLQKNYGDTLEKLSRPDKVRVRSALASWQAYLESSKFLTLPDYLESDSCLESGDWILSQLSDSELWPFIQGLSAATAGIIDPLMACLSHQLYAGVAAEQ